MHEVTTHTLTASSKKLERVNRDACFLTVRVEGLVVLMECCASFIRPRNAALTESSSGKAAATSGRRRMRFVPYCILLIVFTANGQRRGLLSDILSHSLFFSRFIYLSFQTVLPASRWLFSFCHFVQYVRQRADDLYLEWPKSQKSMLSPGVIRVGKCYQASGSANMVAASLKGKCRVVSDSLPIFLGPTRNFPFIQSLYLRIIHQ